MGSKEELRKRLVTAIRAILEYERAVGVDPAASDFDPKRVAEPGEARRLIETGEVAADRMRFVSALGDVLSGAPMRNRFVRVMSRTPSALSSIGIPDLPLLVTPRQLRNAVREHGGGEPHRPVHEIEPDELRWLPELLERPIAISDSDRGNCLRVLVDLEDRTGTPVIAAIDPYSIDTRTQAPRPSNILLTARGRHAIEASLERDAIFGRLLYVDAAQVADLCERRGTEMPEAVIGLNGKIRESAVCASHREAFLAAREAAADRRLGLSSLAREKRAESVARETGARGDGSRPRGAR